MKSFMKIWPIAAAALILLLLFVSCGKTGDAPGTSADTGTEPIADAPALVEDGRAAYTVVYPSSGGSVQREAAERLCESLEEIYGVKFRYSKGAAGATAGRMIRLSFQPESGEAVGYADYRLVVEENGDLTLSAWSETSLGNLCSRLAMRLSAAFDAGDEQGRVMQALEMSGRDLTLIQEEVPILSDSRIPNLFYVSGARGAYELYYPDSGAEDLASFGKILSDNGFEKTSSNENADASFAVYRKETLEVSLDFWNRTGELVAIVDETPADDVSQTAGPLMSAGCRIIDPGQEYEGALKGMCYIIQGSDGSFVIIDGGDDDPVLVDRIYSLMKANIPEGAKPVVRAWFITHIHADHVNGFIRASGTLASLIDCEAVVVNLPVDRYQTAYEKSAYAKRCARLEAAAKAFGAVIKTARTGRTFAFGDVEITVLGSVDDMFLRSYDDLDETSLILSVKCGNSRILFSGDAGALSVGRYVLKRYTSDTLKCDICQATSHGADNSAVSDYYRIASPRYYLWPATADFFSRHTPDKYVTGDRGAEIIYSFNGTRTIELD